MLDSVHLYIFNSSPPRFRFYIYDGAGCECLRFRVITCMLARQRIRKQMRNVLVRYSSIWPEKASGHWPTSPHTLACARAGYIREWHHFLYNGNLSFSTRERKSTEKIYHVPHDHLLLDSVPNLGPLISRWELEKFKNCWNKSFRTSKILTLVSAIFELVKFPNEIWVVQDYGHCPIIGDRGGTFLRYSMVCFDLSFAFVVE